MGEPNMTNFYENLPDNSHKNRNEKKELPEGKRAEKVVHGKVKTKKNDMRKFADIFIAEDAANAAKRSDTSIASCADILKPLIAVVKQSTESEVLIDATFAALTAASVNVNASSELLP